MNINDTEYHKPNNFRGYMLVPVEVFDQITPYLCRDQEKMHRLTRDMPVEHNKHNLTWLPEEGVECKEWSGYLIIVEKQEGGATEEATSQATAEA